MTPALKLTYFELKGRGEPIRLALHIGDIPFEDVRVSFSEFGALKGTGAMPFESVPVLEVDGEKFAESGAILRYAGKLTGLYPKCEKAALKVDMIIDGIETLLAAIFPAKTDEDKKKFIEELIPRYVAPVDKIYGESKGPYLMGEQISIADLKVKCALDVLIDGGMFSFCKPDALDQYTHVKAVMKAVSNNDKVKEWDAMHA